MNKKIVNLYICGAVIAFFSVSVHAQSNNPYLNQAKQYFNAGHYKKSMAELEQGIKQGADNHTLAEMELYLGVCNTYEFHSNAAKEAFIEMFIDDPDFQVNPQGISADILQHIQSIRSTMKGNLEITCNPVKCDIQADGRQIPWAISVNNTQLTSGIGRMKLDFIPVDSRYFSTSKMVTVEYDKTSSIPIEFKPREGSLIINGSPDGADVYLDGINSGTLPFNKQVIIGGHELRINADNYNSFKKSISIPENGTVKEEVNLTPANATLDIDVMPNDSSIYLDHIPYGTTPYINITLPPLHNYNIKISKSGYADYKGNLYLHPGEQFTITENLERVYAHTIEANVLIPDSGIFPLGFGLEYEVKPWATSAFQMNPVVGLYVGLGGWYAQGSEFSSGDSNLMIGYIPIEIRIPNRFVINLYGTFEPYYYSGSTPRQSISGIDEMGEAGVRLAVSNFYMKAGYLFQDEIGGVVASLGFRL